MSKNGKVPEVSEEEKNKLKQGLAAVLEGAEEEKKKRLGEEEAKCMAECGEEERA